MGRAKRVRYDLSRVGYCNRVWIKRRKKTAVHPTLLIVSLLAVFLTTRTMCVSFHAFAVSCSQAGSCGWCGPRRNRRERRDDPQPDEREHRRQRDGGPRDHGGETFQAPSGESILLVAELRHLVPYSHKSKTTQPRISYTITTLFYIINMIF